MSGDAGSKEDTRLAASSRSSRRTCNWNIFTLFQKWWSGDWEEDDGLISVVLKARLPVQCGVDESHTTWARIRINPEINYYDFTTAAISALRSQYNGRSQIQEDLVVRHLVVDNVRDDARVQSAAHVIHRENYEGCLGFYHRKMAAEARPLVIVVVVIREGTRRHIGLDGEV
ncbi:MAG: hypothetical protein Q9181_001700 [Wetmoreana brouardii]